MFPTIEVEAKFLTQMAAQLTERGMFLEQPDCYWDKLTLLRKDVVAFNPTNNGMETTVRTSTVGLGWYVNMPYKEFLFLYKHPFLYQVKKLHEWIRMKLIIWSIKK